MEGGHEEGPGSSARDPECAVAFYSWVSRAPRPPPFSIPPWVPLHCPTAAAPPCHHRLRRGCRPPERPRAAWAAGGASCEAAGRGLGCGLPRRPSCFSEVQLPLPSHPSLLPPRAAPLPHPPRGLSFPLSGTPTRESGDPAHREGGGLERGRRPAFRPSFRPTATSLSPALLRARAGIHRMLNK